MGELIAKSGYDVVYGGSELGLMGEVTKSAISNGSKIIGVMPEKLYNLGISKGACDEFILTSDMRTRKAKMDELSKAVICLAGGFGTVEELSEMIVQKQLGYSNKPIVILNTNGYFDDLIKFFSRSIDEKFAPVECREIYYVAKTPNDAINYVLNYKPRLIDYLKDKLAILKK